MKKSGSKRELFSDLSFRTRLIISNAVLASIVIIGIAFYLVSRTTATNDFLAEQLTQTVQENTQSVLNGTASLHANTLDQFFHTITVRLETLRDFVQAGLANEANNSPANASSLTQLSQGSWDNPDTDPGSIFVPKQEVIPPSVLSELDVLGRIDLIARGILDTNPDVLSVYFASVQGEIIQYPNVNLAATLPANYDVTGQPWFTTADPESNPERKMIWSHPFKDIRSNNLAITGSIPIYDSKDQFRGVVAMDIRLTPITELASNIRVGQTGYAFVIDAKGHVISLPEKGQADFGLAGLKSFKDDPLSESVLKTAPTSLFQVLAKMTTNQGGLKSAKINGVDKYIAYRPISTLGDSLGIIVPVDEMQGKVLVTQQRLELERRSTFISLVVGILVVLLTFLVATYWIGNALTAPLIQLTHTASQIAQGDLNAIATVNSRDEIGVMASTFNLMTKNLRDLIEGLELRVKERTAELSREKEFSEALVRNSPGAIVSINANANIIAWNPAAVSLFGYSEAEALGNKLDDLVVNSENTGTEVIGITSQMAAGGFHAITKQVRKDGSLVDVDIRAVPLVLENQMGVIAIYHDITELQQARHEAESARDESLRLLKVTEERNAELGAISKVSQALIVESELDNTIKLIGTQMHDIFNADIVYVALLDPSTNLIHFPYQVGESFTTLKAGEGHTGRIIQTGEAILINENMEGHSDVLGVTPVGRNALSYLGVPIKTSQGTIGVISVQSTTQEGLFNEDSVRLLTTIAANAGAAITNAQLFSEALENLRQVEILTNAASAIEQSAYDPAMITSVAARTDALGELARVFRKMADEVRLREQRLKRQLAQLQLDIEEKQLAKAETVAVYIPMDRRQALASRRSLPEHVQGAALFADISGFTALTEALSNELGMERGAEEVIRQLNRVYTVLIDEVHRYSGSVINFSGDAITCWFDDLNVQGRPYTTASVERAAACALAMQKGMAQFAAITRPDGKIISLSIKVAVAAGPARRLLVGEGTAHQIDVLAGSTLSTLANAEHHAERGETIISAEGISSIENTFSIAEWREEKQYAVITGLMQEVSPTPWAVLATDAIPEAETRSWMHPAVFEKVRAGKSDMLSELRQVAALFLKFGGLDYDHDSEAGARLNTFIQWVEGIIAPHNGSIIQLTVGDKGSYLYVVFGAPIANKDDAAQAVLAGLELAAPPESLAYITNIQIGLAYGQMRSGAYGGTSHRTYGSIGDKTNLAARLMQAAVPTAEQRSDILCNESIYNAARAQVEFEPLAPIKVKGKTETIAIYRPIRKLVELTADSGIAPERAQVIDRLSPAEQLTLKAASVIGQLFTLESLSAIYPEEHKREDLQAHLQTLTDLDLIAKRPNEGSSYRFKDPQTHEAAYNLMLFAQRRQLHRAVAELLEQNVFSVPTYAEIAHHWKAADETPKAIEYLEKAGEHARQMGDFEEATRFFNESLELGN